MTIRVALRMLLPVVAMAALAACATPGASGFVDVSVAPGDGPRMLAFAWEFRGHAQGFRLERSADAAAPFRPVDLDGDGDADATDAIPASRDSLHLPISLHRTDFARARYRLVALAPDGAARYRSSPLSLAGIPLERLIGYFRGAGPVAGGWFGTAVALSAAGDVLAVGAPGEGARRAGDRGPAPRAGAVYVFTRDSPAAWSRQRLRPAGIEAGELFGASLALSADGRTLAVGSPGVGRIDRAPGRSVGPWVGAVRVFRRGDSGAWVQQARLQASNPGARDAFGARIALSADGSTLAVGAWGEDGTVPGSGAPAADRADDAVAFARGAGAVYVFTRDDAGAWSGPAYVKAWNAGGNDWFGDAVALSANGDVLAVGASKEDGGAAGIDGGDDDRVSGAGAVYVFARSGTGHWARQAYVKGPAPAAGDGFGVSVALSGDGRTLAAGAWNEDGPGGAAVSDAGAVHLYRRGPADRWEYRGLVRAANAGAGDAFGASLALSADATMLAVGAWGEDGDATGIDGPDNDHARDAGPFPAGAGAVYVFRRARAGGWTQQAYVKARNTGPGDVFGSSVALSADGTVLAVGASNEDGAGALDGATETAGTVDAGAVYLY